MGRIGVCVCVCARVCICARTRKGEGRLRPGLAGWLAGWLAPRRYSALERCSPRGGERYYGFGRKRRDPSHLLEARPLPISFSHLLTNEQCWEHSQRS